MKTLPVLLISLIALHLFLSSTSPPIVDARPLQPIQESLNNWFVKIDSAESPNYERASPANRAPPPGLEKYSIYPIQNLLQKLYSPIQYTAIHFSLVCEKSFSKWFSKMDSVERPDDSVASVPNRAPPPGNSFKPIQNLIQKLSEKLSQCIGSAST